MSDLSGTQTLLPASTTDGRSGDGSAVSMTFSHFSPYSAGGVANSMGASCALKKSRNELSTWRWPYWPRSRMPSPLTNRAPARPKSLPQASPAICRPSGVNHSRSGSGSPPPRAVTGRPVKNRRRWNTWWRWRNAVSLRENSSSVSSAFSQSIQLIGLSWQYALLFPPWVRPSSSPCEIIGTPWLSSSVARKLRRWRARRASTALSSVGPSTPQFQDRLWLSPSRFSSPLASLCLSLYDTDSCSGKLSCGVTKLIEGKGLRPSSWYRSAEPVIRLANSARVAGSPRQKCGTVSRGLPFHSGQFGGEVPPP